VWGLHFTFVFLVKRLILAVCVVFLKEMPFLQIQVVVFMLSLDLIYTGQVQPFASKFLNRMEMINNVFILLCSYYLFLFTEFVPSPEAKFNLGWSLVAVYWICIVFNTAVLVFIAIRNAYRKLRRRY